MIDAALQRQAWSGPSLSRKERAYRRRRVHRTDADFNLIDELDGPSTVAERSLPIADDA